MSETTPGERPLTEPERQAFQKLGLTPGHWARLLALRRCSTKKACGRTEPVHSASDLSITRNVSGVRCARWKD